MAFYVKLFKSGEEDKNFVYYIYQFSYPAHEIKKISGKIRYKTIEVQGKLKIDKRNGDVHTMELAQGDNGEHAKRAAWALIRHWKKGEFPDNTYWAS